jgi:L-threonylcarbamoyladenylate synthase
LKAVQTRVLACSPADPKAEVVAEAARVLRAGGLVAFPTETVYGLGALALDEAAVARVFEAKGRPRTHPLIAHVDGEAAARALAAEWPDVAERLARAFWPGPLTLVVKRAAHVPAAVAGGAATIAVRAPAHPVARALIRAAGEPIAAPSANRYQTISPTTAAHVVKTLAGAIELVLDGGPCAAGIESTVVDVTGVAPRVLRPGAVSLSALRAVAPDVVAARDEEAPPEDAVRASPGMDARHYAPRARLVIVETWHEAQAAALRCAGSGAKVGLVLHTRRDALALDLARGGYIAVRTLPSDAAGYARELFSTLHDLDDDGVDVIVVENVPADDAWWAVADRLRRGATETAR